MADGPSEERPQPKARAKETQEAQRATDGPLAMAEYKAEHQVDRAKTIKHLIFLVDGTWVASDLNLASQQYSNVYKLNLSLKHADKDGNPQIVFYTRGIGSTSSLRRYTAGGFVSGIDEMITEIYVNMVSNYTPGDKVYLFGFSRGAVIVRAVTGLLGRFGLLTAARMGQYAALWKQFVSYQGGEDDKDFLATKSSCLSGIEIEFVGAFDTVFGGNENKDNMFSRLRFSSRRLDPCIKTAVHILSLDEDRRRFNCMTWDEISSSEHQQLEQIWMPGVHSDVGGTYAAGTLGDLSLLTMIDRVKTHTQLEFHDEKTQYLANAITKDIYYSNISINRERAWYLPLRRSVRKPSSNDPNQFVHRIVPVMTRDNVTYRPEKTKRLYTVPRNNTWLPLMRPLKHFKIDQLESLSE
jgi:uncharacterized protein (DUF2235 family)